MMQNGQNGLIFNTEGPMMSGTWYNPSTGDSFTVRDSFFEDNQFVVSTTDGRILNYNQIQHYVKSDKPLDMQPDLQKNTKHPAEVMDLIEPINETSFDLLPEDQSLIGGNLRDSGDRRINLNNNYTNFNQNALSNAPIIGKALSKIDLPEVDLKLKWKQSPDKEILLLMDVMDISLDEIVEWYMNKFNMDEIRQRVQHEVKILLYNKYGRPEPSDESVTEEKPIKTKEKKIKTKS